MDTYLKELSYLLELKKDFVESIRSRIPNGMTFYDIAELSGLNIHTIERFFSGTNVTFKTAAKILVAIDLYKMNKNV